MLDRYNTIKNTADQGRVTHIGGLNVKISAFNYYHNTPADNTRNMVTVAASASYSITAAAASYYVYVTIGATAVAHAVTLPAKAIPLALVTTDGSKITTVVDKRALYSSPEIDWTNASQNFSTTGTMTVGGKFSDGAVVDSTEKGYLFTYLTGTTLRMSANGIDAKFYIPVFKSGTSALLNVTLGTALSINTATSGLGGRDTGALANSTGYYIFLITKDSGADPGLVMSLSSSTPTLPTDYTHISQPLWFIRIDSAGNIFKFIDKGGICWYDGTGVPQTVDSLKGVTAGTAVSATAINWTNLVPKDSLGYFRAELTNNAATVEGTFTEPRKNTLTIRHGSSTSQVPVASFRSAGLLVGKKGSSHLITAEGVNVAAGQSYSFLVPSHHAGYVLTKAFAKVLTAGSGGSTTTVEVKRTRSGSTVDMLSTNMSIAAAGTDSGTTAVINTSNDDLADQDLIKINVATMATSTAPQGLIVLLEFGDGDIVDEYTFNCSIVDPATSMYYQWLDNPGTGNGAAISVMGWELRR